MYLSSLILLLGAWFLFFGVHAIMARLFRRWNPPPQRIAFQASLLTAAAVVALLLFVEPTWNLSKLAFVVLISGLMAHVYFHFFNMSETARRAKILVSVKLGTFSNSRLPYSPSEMIRLRLSRLVELSWVRKQDDRYYPKKTLLTIVSDLMIRYENFIFPKRSDRA